MSSKNRITVCVKTYTTRTNQINLWKIKHIKEQLNKLEFEKRNQKRTKQKRETTRQYRVGISSFMLLIFFWFNKLDDAFTVWELCGSFHHLIGEQRLNVVKIKKINILKKMKQNNQKKKNSKQTDRQRNTKSHNVLESRLVFLPDYFFSFSLIKL